MSEFTFEINEDQDTVELPAFLAHAKGLTCAEIGMIFMIASLVCDQHPGITMHRMGAEQSDAIKSLKEKGVLIAEHKGGNKVSMKLDLDVLETMTPEEYDQLPDPEES